MPRRQRWVARLKKIKIPVYCYLLAVIIWLATSAVACIGDAISHANGSLSEQSLVPADFALYDMELQPDGSYLCTSDDPQMILSSLDGQVRTLRFWADYSGYSFEMNLYYTTSPGPEQNGGRLVKHAAYGRWSRRTAATCSPCPARQFTPCGWTPPARPPARN